VRRLGKRRAWAAAAALLAALALFSLGGCAQLAYLQQSAGGHLQLLRAAKPVPEWLAEPGLDPGLRERLLLSQRLRDFASQRLQLPDNKSYRRYAQLDRPAVVWNVVATPELSLSPKTWCFPIMGCVVYRGNFKREAADAFAGELRTQGWEVSVYGVPAYSTLGWSNWVGGDPLLSTFINYPEGELARMIFHELAHQVAYAADDSVFNESFATAVELIGAQAWLAEPGHEAARQADALQLQRRQAFLELVLHYRERLTALYAQPLADADKRQAKQALMAELRAEYADLKQEPGSALLGYSGYDGWFARANNAGFALLGAYHELTPAFEALYERQGRDWPRFYAEVQRLAALPREQRRQALAAP